MNQQNLGFSVLELMVTVAVMMVASAVGYQMISDNQKSSAHQARRTQVMGLLTQAETKLRWHLRRVRQVRPNFTGLSVGGSSCDLTRNFCPGVRFQVQGLGGQLDSFEIRTGCFRKDYETSPKEELRLDPCIPCPQGSQPGLLTLRQGVKKKFFPDHQGSLGLCVKATNQEGLAALEIKFFAGLSTVGTKDQVLTREVLIPMIENPQNLQILE